METQNQEVVARPYKKLEKVASAITLTGLALMIAGTKDCLDSSAVYHTGLAILPLIAAPIYGYIIYRDKQDTNKRKLPDSLINKI